MTHPFLPSPDVLARLSELHWTREQLRELHPSQTPSAFLAIADLFLAMDELLVVGFHIAEYPQALSPTERSEIGLALVPTGLQGLAQLEAFLTRWESANPIRDPDDWLTPSGDPPGPRATDGWCFGPLVARCGEARTPLHFRGFSLTFTLDTARWLIALHAPPPTATAQDAQG